MATKRNPLIRMGTSKDPVAAAISNLVKLRPTPPVKPVAYLETELGFICKNCGACYDTKTDVLTHISKC